MEEITHIFDQFNAWKISWKYRDILHHIEISWNIVCIVKKQYCSRVVWTTTNRTVYESMQALTKGRLCLVTPSMPIFEPLIPGSSPIPRKKLSLTVAPAELSLKRIPFFSYASCSTLHPQQCGWLRRLYYHSFKLFQLQTGIASHNYNTFLY